jgi:hypothetical protein
MSPAQAAEEMQLRQEAGLSALQSLASYVAVHVTGANPALADKDWWPDTDEATYRSQQEKGMAALIAIAANIADPQRSPGARQYIRPRFQPHGTRRSKPKEYDLPSNRGLHSSRSVALFQR